MESPLAELQEELNKLRQQNAYLRSRLEDALNRLIKINELSDVPPT
jgi:uncharacterized coiled-coil protein SlyX